VVLSQQGHLHTLETVYLRESVTWNLQWNVKSCWYRFSWSYEDAEWFWTCAEIISIDLMRQQMTTFISFLKKNKNAKFTTHMFVFNIDVTLFWETI